MKTAAFLLLALAAWGDSSGTAPKPDLEWRDESGRLLKRKDGWGRETFYTHDDQGRVIEVAGSDVWKHLFLYRDDGGGLLAELDCIGTRHEFSAPPVIDLKAGTALKNHRHLPPARLPHWPTASPNGTRFEYDLDGGLKTSTPTGAKND